MNSFHFKQLVQVLFIVFSAVLGFLSTAGAKPTIPFSLPQSLQGFQKFNLFTQQTTEGRNTRPLKTYSGKRVSNDSLLMIYYHDRTIAITELGPQKLLLGCELVEIFNDNEGKLQLEELSKFNKPLEIKFNEMLKLMNQCETVDKQTYAARGKRKSVEPTPDPAVKLAANIFPQSPLTLLSGIIPGTKWCGTGDIAQTYHDLGAETNMDRCCRQHDLCPVKIGAFKTKYDLTNESIYTKSHCSCDDMFFTCLKKTNSSTSQWMGSIYFNLVQVACLNGEANNYEFRAAKEGF